MLFGRKKQKNEKDMYIKKNTGVKERIFNKTLEDNVRTIKDIFSNDDTLIMRSFENQHNASVKCFIVYIDGMVNIEIINENLIQPIVQNTMLSSFKDALNILQKQIIITNYIVKTSDADTVVKSIISGNTAFFLDGSAEVLIISTKGWQARSISEPEVEKVFRGPREGFTEPIKVNLSLIRRKLLTPDLKFKFMTIGVRTGTNICVCYIEGIVNKKILNEVYKRLSEINIDGILGTGYIEELIRDSPFSPFDTMGYTERPDVVAAKLLEGRIAIIADGTPTVLTVPFLFTENFQTNEDYNLNFYISSISRLLRILSFIITISVPGVYVAMLTYHQEMIPTPLLLNISAARQGVPFPTIAETALLLFIFEILRETGIRMPSSVGQALSIVGALVLGQASVEARVVSAPIVIVVSVSALTGLITPKIKGAVIIMRTIFLLLSAFLGLYGYIFGVTGLLIHLCGMRSFGIPYMLYSTVLKPEDIKDTIIRAPWWYLKYRPKLIAANNKIRLKNGAKKR